MKQLIVLLSTVILGVFIFQQIAGPKDSIYVSLKNVWSEEAETRTVRDFQR